MTDPKETKVQLEVAERDAERESLVAKNNKLRVKYPREAALAHQTVELLIKSYKDAMLADSGLLPRDKKRQTIQNCADLITQATRIMNQAATGSEPVNPEIFGTIMMNYKKIAQIDNKLPTSTRGNLAL